MEMQKWLVTSGRAVEGSIVRAQTAAKAAEKAFQRKRLSGMPGGIEPDRENYVTVYELYGGTEFYPEIEYTLTGVKEKP